MNKNIKLNVHQTHMQADEKTTVEEVLSTDESSQSF